MMYLLLRFDLARFLFRPLFLYLSRFSFCFVYYLARIELFSSIAHVHTLRFDSLFGFVIKVHVHYALA
jgi:hypothetical protein